MTIQDTGGTKKTIEAGVARIKEMLPRANAVRRDLGEDVMRRLSVLLRESIKYGLDHREAALEYAGKYGRGLNDDLTDRFVGMYVNERTLEYGDDGRKAVAELLRRAAEAGLIPAAVPVDFVDA